MNIYQKANQISFIEVLNVFAPQVTLKQKGKHLFALCPFHDEKTPSFVVYKDGFKCFGCTAAGDAVKFVALLEGVSNFEAAQRIARAFNVGQVILSKKARKATKERELRRALDTWRHYCFNRLAKLNDVFLFHIKSTNINVNPYIFNKQQVLENYLNILATGTQEEIISLYQDDEFRRW